MRSHRTWRAYSRQLNEIRGHANDLFHDYSRLQKIEHCGTPQQREAIKRLEPIVHEMAASLTGTIQLLNDHHQGVNLPAFTSRIHSHYVTIDNLYQELCKCTGKNAG